MGCVIGWVLLFAGEASARKAIYLTLAAGSR